MEGVAGLQDTARLGPALGHAAPLCLGALSTCARLRRRALVTPPLGRPGAQGRPSRRPGPRPPQSDQHQAIWSLHVDVKGDHWLAVPTAHLVLVCPVFGGRTWPVGVSMGDATLPLSDHGALGPNQGPVWPRGAPA